MSSFIELISIYKWTVPASIFMAGVLSLIGAQWTARGKSAQIFVLGQGSSLGVVLGLALNIWLGQDIHALSLFLGFSLGWMTLVLSDRIGQNRSDRNHVYLTLFVLFLALTYLLTSLTPALESHMATAYFGDLAVMSDGAAQGSLVLAVFTGFFILKNWRSISQVSFQLSNASLIHTSRRNLFFEAMTLVLTAAAVQNMGYLFTLGSLFIATSFATARSKNLTSYTVKIVAISVLGSLLGFIASLISTNLPTVPCVVVGQIIVGLVSYVKK